MTSASIINPSPENADKSQCLSDRYFRLFLGFICDILRYNVPDTFIGAFSLAGGVGSGHAATEKTRD
jgi:hypothetical protein